PRCRQGGVARYVCVWSCPFRHRRGWRKFHRQRFCHRVAPPTLSHCGPRPDRNHRQRTALAPLLPTTRSASVMPASSILEHVLSLDRPRLIAASRRLSARIFLLSLFAIFSGCAVMKDVHGLWSFQNLKTGLPNQAEIHIPPERAGLML